MTHRPNKDECQLYISALIAVGRDISENDIFRNLKLKTNDQTPGSSLFKFETGSSLQNDDVVETESDVIEWISTPGHTGHCCSLIITGNCHVTRTGSDSEHRKYERVALVGDLWDEENDDQFWKDLSENNEAQSKSRNFIKNICKPNLIIPGHGTPFQF